MRVSSDVADHAHDFWLWQAGGGGGEYTSRTSHVAAVGSSTQKYRPITARISNGVYWKKSHTTTANVDAVMQCTAIFATKGMHAYAHYTGKNFVMRTRIRSF